MSTMYTVTGQKSTGNKTSVKNKQLTYGDLINSRSKPADHTLDGWLSHLDDFGMLVLAAASLAS